MNDESIHTPKRPAHVHQAAGKLSVLLGVPVDQAALGLDLCAQFRGVSLDEAAKQIMDARAKVEDRELAILRQHLESASKPLDQ